MASNSTVWRTLLLVMLPILALTILSITVAIAYGQTNTPQHYIIRRVEIWNQFYRGMVAAFIVGALVQGAIVYVAWRFRESNEKTWGPRKPQEDLT